MTYLNTAKPWILAVLLAATSTYAQCKPSNPPPCKQKECFPCKPKAPPCKPKECSPCKPKTPPCKPKECEPCKPKPTNPCCPPCFEQGHEMPNECARYGYSAPAGFDTQCSWDVYTTASYLYWQAREENLDLGMTSDTANPFSNDNFNRDFIQHNYTLSKVVHPHFTFRSGFKVGLGVDLDYDNWDAYAEYTWFHGHIETGIKPFPAPNVLGSGGLIYPEQGHPAGDSSIAPLGYYSANSNWHLKMDFADLSLARSYYSGTKLTIRPFFGARGAWIRQQMFNIYNGSTNSATKDTNLMYVSSVTNRTVSQGIGPRGGFESNWLLGYGFRLIGNGSLDILYTRYHFLFRQKRISLPNAGSTSTNAKFKEEHEDYLRTHADLEMGFGWGTYLDDQRWHIDLSASYGFQIFWDQNMFRNFTDDAMQGKSFVPNGNLYIHGLTATARLDF